MLDPRVYRAAFLPVLMALFLAAFSLQERPPAATTTLAPDAFDGDRALGAGSAPAQNSLRELAASFPDRRTGSPGDNALADRIERVLRQERFQTNRISTPVDTPDGPATAETVIGVRLGVSSRRLVVLAHRDARRRGSAAELSATAALIELAKVSRGRQLNKTLVIVSTSGGAFDAGGARAFAEGASDRVDGVLVLGDVATCAGDCGPREDDPIARVHKPFVVPWSNATGQAPLMLQRTVESATRREVGTDPGAYRATAQWARLAFPLALGEQGAIQRAGLPAVTLSITGERDPRPDDEVSQALLVKFGRAAVRALSGMDAMQSELEPQPVLTTGGKVLPEWVVRLVIGVMLLPALIASLDAWARARRMGERVLGWVLWTLLGAIPFALAWGWTRLMDTLGAVTAPSAPVEPALVPINGAAWAAIVSGLVVVLLGWFGLRPLLWRGFGVHTVSTVGHENGTAGTAIGLVLVVVAFVVWSVNPYAAGILVPAVHLWLLAAAGEARPRWGIVVPGIALGFLLAVLVAAYYASALDLGPGGVLWLGWLLVAGGHITPAGAVAGSVLLGCVASVLSVLFARRQADVREIERPVRTRGPRTYAGPGSLGGTESALPRQR